MPPHGHHNGTPLTGHALRNAHLSERALVRARCRKAHRLAAHSPTQAGRLPTKYQG